MLVAFGVEATSPNTHVGWQKLGESLDFPGCEVKKIVEFTEKPNLDTAKKYMEQAGYCWNSGQFAWKAETILQEIDTHLPQATAILKKIGAEWNKSSFEQVLNNLFPKMPTGSIDYKVMQKTSKACSIFLPCSWEDMGTHAAMAEKIGTKYKNNIVSGKAVLTGSGNKVFAHTDQSVVTALDNIIVVVTKDTVFIGNPDTDMKALIESVAKQAPEIL
jgi:mannose-1-phosphate guanylyltransferase